ncbi:uncharacterized protein KD926_006483 [Aspergillus affinis]|uniref:uncharacterized protein n=1 Tax=Aspergillus affinis TaxID=1070780 RepID=UPI0022FE0820|nr:uncharacterized protein KD926_006483 [Aspergillus affinis]KAI9041759.1 hypothetical protein KD926_006483 [Aspergillus affinis]
MTEMTKKKYDDIVDPGRLQHGEMQPADAVTWLGAVAVMTKTQIGLGVLSIPASLDTLGMIPGVIVLVVMAVITTWSNYMIGVFKLRHPSVYNIDDVGQMLFGRPGRIILGSVDHFNRLECYVSSRSIIRTLSRISWLAWVGVMFIITSIIVLTISVGLQGRPSTVSQTQPWESDFQLTSNSPSFPEAISAVAAILNAYAGTPGFFAIVSEMRNPHHYTRSLLICQSGVTVLYLAVGITVYYYCGSYVASPALGSAGLLMKRVCYGFALPGLVVSTFLFVHVRHCILSYLPITYLPRVWNC